MSEKYVYQLDRTGIFKKDLKKAIKRGCDIALLNEIVDKLLRGEPLPPKNKDHGGVNKDYYVGIGEANFVSASASPKIGDLNDDDKIDIDDLMIMQKIVAS